MTKMNKINIKICPECGHNTCFLLPRFKWEKGLISIDEKGKPIILKNTCPRCP
jgi:hypothetical protein